MWLTGYVYGCYAYAVVGHVKLVVSLVWVGCSYEDNWDVNDFITVQYIVQSLVLKKDYVVVFSEVPVIATTVWL